MEVVDGTCGFWSRHYRQLDSLTSTSTSRPSSIRCDSRPAISQSALEPQGDEYRGSVPIGTVPPCGPPVTPENILYYTSVQDGADYTVSSKMYYQFAEMSFGTDFVPRFEHFPRDDFPVPLPPKPCD